MSLSAEPLSPIDAATLWPQVSRLSTEVIATRGNENLLVSAALATTGLTRLPRVTKTVVMGVRQGLGYRGVLVARELGTGVAWEVHSLRIARDTDPEAITALLNAAAAEIARRGGHAAFLRHAEGSPHEGAIRRGGFTPYTAEQLYALPARARSGGPQRLRPVVPADAHGIFRLYCRLVPDDVRRYEAPTLEDWEAVRDSYDNEEEYVFDGEGTVSGWVGIGAREGRVLLSGNNEQVDFALDAIERALGRQGTLVAAVYQDKLAGRAAARGYTELGTRVVCVRHMAVPQTIKEAVAVTDTFAVPQ
ncbi:MAG: hypothetical protein Kow0010_04790 [Dehalococcoidia bacterium]